MGHDRTSAPAELPYLNSLNTAEVIEKYGKPMLSLPTSDGTTYLGFRNDVFIGVRDGKVYRYGIIQDDLHHN